MRKNSGIGNGVCRALGTMLFHLLADWCIFLVNRHRTSSFLYLLSQYWILKKNQNKCGQFPYCAKEPTLSSKNSVKGVFSKPSGGQIVAAIGLGKLKELGISM